MPDRAPTPKSSGASPVPRTNKLKLIRHRVSLIFLSTERRPARSVRGACYLPCKGMGTRGRSFFVKRCSGGERARPKREQVNKYMTAVLHEEPVDPTLVDFDDSEA